MTNNETLFEPLRVTSDAGKLAVDVPWREAEALQTYLRQKDLGATICFDPRTHEARLEMWPGVDADALRQALTGWRQEPDARL